MDISQVLEELGLVDKEAEVYMALISTPGVQPASLIAKKAGLNRTTTYKTLNRLADKGLAIKSMKHGIVCFYTEDPEKSLESLLNNKRKALESLKDRFMGMLPELKDLQTQELIIPKMRIYEGIEGVKRVYDDTLVEDNNISAFYASDDVEEMPPEIRDYIFNENVPKRVDKKIAIKIVTTKSAATAKVKSKDPDTLSEYRFLEKNVLPPGVEINIYGNKTAFLSFKEEEMFGVILESHTIASAMLAIFGTIWRLAK